MTKERYDAMLIIDEATADARESLMLSEGDFIMADEEEVVVLMDDLQTKLKEVYDDFVAEHVKNEEPEDDKNYE